MVDRPKLEKYLETMLASAERWERERESSEKNLLDKVMHAPENVLKYQNNNPRLTFF